MDVRPSPSGMQIAPVTGNNIGVARAEVKQGVRSVILCKDASGKFGLRVQAVSKVCAEFASSTKSRLLFFFNVTTCCLNMLVRVIFAGCVCGIRAQELTSSAGWSPLWRPSAADQR